MLYLVIWYIRAHYVEVCLIFISVTFLGVCCWTFSAEVFFVLSARTRLLGCAGAAVGEFVLSEHWESVAGVRSGAAVASGSAGLMSRGQHLPLTHKND